MSNSETMRDTEYYSWGTSALAFAFGGFTVARPALSEHE
jgi:hypothetical protein